jgi:hypothetical protein
LTKLAVIVPAVAKLAFVLALVEESKVIPAVPLHEPNLYPADGVAVMAKGDDWSVGPPDGEVEPPADGLDTIVILYAWAFRAERSSAAAKSGAVSFADTDLSGEKNGRDRKLGISSPDFNYVLIIF